MSETVKQSKKAPKKKPDTKGKALKRRVAEAEARKAELDVQRAELNWELDQLRADEARLTYNLKTNSDLAHGHFALEKSVGRTAVDLAADIRQYARTFPEAPVTLNIFSPGGSLLDGLVLYDTLRTVAAQGHLVTTVARGYAASMAAVLFLAGDVRLMGAEAEIMVHSLSAGGGGSLHELEDDLKFYKKLQGKLDGIITGRTKITQDLLDKKTKKADWWISGPEALKLKVAHEVI